MSRLAVFVALLTFCVLPVSQKAISQGIGKLDERTKVADSAQQKSWQQVDQINKEADKTTTRLQQSRQSAAQSTNANAGYSVKATTVGKRGAYKKPSLKQQRELAKEK
jgi:hypothetical protein